MPRKKSVKGAAGTFKARVGALDAFYDAALSSSLTDQQITWAVEAALIKLSAQFEHMVLHALVGAINNNMRSRFTVARRSLWRIIQAIS